MIYDFLLVIYHYFTYFLAPPFCLFCNACLEKRQALCLTCISQILPVVPFDLYCGKGQNIRVFAFSAYKDPLRTLILAKHMHQETHVHMLANFVVQDASLFEYIEFDYIVPIPLHWTRYARRGFNQAKILANIIGKKTGKPVLDVLTRSKKTQYQAYLSAQERQSNVQNAFQISPAYVHVVSGKKILLVDDLYTTGSTIKAAASVLWQYKPAQIDVFVICRVVSSA